MPLYEYKCSLCGSRFEVMQKVHDPAPAKCPKCGGPCKKILSPPTLQFKGTGWYITDYAGRKAGDKEKKAEEKTKSGTEESAKTSDPSSSND